MRFFFSFLFMIILGVNKVMSGAPVNHSLPPNNPTPLIRAVLEGHEEEVRRLIKDGAKIEENALVWGEMLTPLTAALKSERLSMIRLLIDLGAKTARDLSELKVAIIFER